MRRVPAVVSPPRRDTRPTAISAHHVPARREQQPSRSLEHGGRDSRAFEVFG